MIYISKKVLGFFLVVTMLSADDSVLIEMLKSSNLKIDYNKITTGEILEFPREDQESTNRSIALSMGVFLKAPFKDVLVALEKGDNALSDYKNAKFIDIKDTKNIKPYFRDMGFASDEEEEIEMLYDDGDAFNLSEKELQRWKIVKEQRGKTKRELASMFMREVLETRLKSYMKGGVENLEDYTHDGENIEVKKALKSSNMRLSSFKKVFPKFYKDYINYPKVTSSLYTQHFYAYKDLLDDRPVFMLKHQMYELKNNVLMVAERQFYISHGLDAIQMQLICLPYKDGTFVALSSQSFTEKVDSFARSIAVRVGRSMMSKQIRPMLEALQKEFNH